MDYYEHFEDVFEGEPIPEDLIDRAIDDNGYLHFGYRMMIVMELVGITTQMTGGQELPTPLRDRIARLWSTGSEDYGFIREDMDSFIALWNDYDFDGR